MDIIKDLLLNFFLIFICFFTFLAIKVRKAELAKPLLFFLASLAVVFCITFPIRLDENIIIDLRLIPIVVTGLYGGWRFVLSLMIVNIIYRMLWGGIGVYLTMILAVIIGILICATSSLFLSLSLKRKLLFSIGIGVIFTAMEMALVSYVYQQIPVTIWIAKIALQTGGILFFVLLWEMVKSYKSLHEQMLRTEKMEVVSHLASSFSHEVRNPMTTVKGFLQLMTDPKIDREKINRYIKIAISEIDRAEAIIKEYLAFTKPTSGEKQMIKGHELLESSIEVIRPLANANSVTIKFNNNPFYIEGNKQRMQQALINLYKNAIEAMQSGGTLTVTVDVRRDDAVVSIEDSGIGMTKEQISRLGEPYFSTKGEQGTGLGMMVVYHIIESMGGTIDVNSQVGKGTKFSLFLPTQDGLT